MNRLLTILFLLMSAADPALAESGDEIYQIAAGFKEIPAAIMVGMLILYVLVGISSRVSSPVGYWIAGRGVGRIGNGAAIAADWMSAASFMGVAGLLYLEGWFGLGYIVGWTGGYVLLLCLMAAQLRRFGRFTIPEFLGDRYDCNLVRIAASVITVLIAVTYATAQFKGIGLVCGWIFGISYEASIFLTVGVVALYLLASGMKGVTRNQQIQYVVLLTAFILPLWGLMRSAGSDSLIPQFGYGELLSRILDGESATGLLDSETLSGIRNLYLPWGGGDIYHFLSLIFTLMVGTAGLPHIMVRFYTVTTAAAARGSVIWGLFFIGLIYWSSPVYATLGRYFNPTGGGSVADVIILSAPERAGMGEWVLGYLAAGALAAGLSTVAGLLIAGASAVAHDWYASIFKPQTSDAEALHVGRLVSAILCGVVVIFALHPPALIAQIVAMAFALAGNTIFPAMVLGIWYSRSNKYGALAGMIFGLGMTILAMIGWLAHIPLFGDGGLLSAISSSLIVCPLVFAINILVSMLTDDKITEETVDRTEAIMRTIHDIPRDQPPVLQGCQTTAIGE